MALAAALVIGGAAGAVVRSSPAAALGPGEVCVFLQPQGAEIPFVSGMTSPAGHIGWGYLVGGTSTWVFGSTENPNGDYQIDAPNFNGAWSISGSWQQMVDTFTFQTRFPGTFKQPDAAHPYSQYKCRTTPTSSVGAANSAATANATAGYTGIGNNCLDATYRILNAYGVPNLPWPSTHWYPNNWYNALDSTWWSGSLGETWMNVNSGMAMDLDHSNAANGTAVHQWPYNGTDAQWWVQAVTGSGAYELFSRATGKCVGVAGGSTAAGAAVVEWDCVGHPDQRWYWRTAGGTVNGWPVYNLVNENSGQCLGISGGGTTQGTVAVQWPCNGHPDQRWY